MRCTSSFTAAWKGVTSVAPDVIICRCRSSAADWSRAWIAVHGEQRRTREERVADQEEKPTAMLTLAELDEALRGSFAQSLAVQHVEQDVQSLLRVVDDFDLLRLQAIGSFQS